jgi:hypothetical protein
LLTRRVARPTSNRVPPTGRIHDGPPVLAVPPPTEPEPEPPSPPVPLEAVVVVVDEPPPATVVVDDVSPPTVVVDEPGAVEDEVVEDESAVDEVVVAVPAAVSSSPRFPGLAIAKTTPTTNRSVAAAPRIANRRFRGDSPRLEWSG